MLASLQYTCVHVIRMFKITPTLLTSTCEFKLDPKSFIVDASENWSSRCLDVYRIILDMRFYRIIQDIVLYWISG